MITLPLADWPAAVCGRSACRLPADTHFTPATIEARLAGLLPRRGATGHATTKEKTDADDIAKLKSGLVMAEVFFLAVLASQWVATNKEVPAKVDSPAAQNSTAVVPSVPLSH